MSASRNPPRVRRAAPRLPLTVALLAAASATAQERSTTPLMSVDAGFTAAAASSPDAVRPVARTITLRHAVAQAIERNASARVAAADIRRVGGIMEEVRAASLPTLSVNATYTRLNKERTFSASASDGGTESVVVAARDSINITGSLAIPILAPAAWAEWTRAADQLESSKLSQRDVQRTVGVTAARAYLTVFAQKRQVEVNRQARDNSLAHMQYADARLRGGIGNRVDWARAGQDLEQNEALLQSSYANLYRTQEALGILLGEDEPVDVEDVPQIPGMPTLEQALEESQGRADILLFRQQEKSADRSLNMSWTEYLPNITVFGQPFYQEPSSLTTPKTGWQIQAVLTWFLYDGGARYGRTHQREALLEQARVQLDLTLRQANSDVRAALDNVERTSAAVERQKNSARLAEDAMHLADIAYRAGASTNLELIDAQRRARDAETLANIAEDNQRQAFIDLLAASGRFPTQLAQPPDRR
ncbi:MAG TPA: TolC family protein [Myxococcaceae bacterium]|nr:TolC family protein [Myxococcaceae bacterium]